MRPELKQFSDLRPTDFDRVPVWAACNSFDHDEPWYDDTDEETFRPWLGDLPVDPTDGMFLVSARFRLADGRTFTGFATPATPDDEGRLEVMQPHLGVGDRFFSFWGGLVGVADAEKTALLLALGSDRIRTFPIAFECDDRLAAGATGGTIHGFYRSVSLDDVVVE